MSLLLIAVGNPFRQDDGVGLAVAEAVRAARVPGVEIRCEPGEAAGLVEAWRGAARVAVVDAMSSGAPAGTVREFHVGNPRDEADLAAAGCRAFSSHGLGVAAAVGLARQLGALPGALVVIGVEGGAFGTGTALSPDVSGAVARVVARIEALAATATPRRRHRAPRTRSERA